MNKSKYPDFEKDLPSIGSDREGFRLVRDNKDKRGVIVRGRVISGKSKKEF